MRHFRQPVRPKDLRELQRIKTWQGRAGSAVGRGSEWFFKQILIELYQSKKIKEFEKTPRAFPKVDFFVRSLDGKRLKINIKASKNWLWEEEPDVIYIIVGLHPKKEEVLRQLRKHKII